MFRSLYACHSEILDDLKNQDVGSNNSYPLKSKYIDEYKMRLDTIEKEIKNELDKALIKNEISQSVL